MAISGRPTLAFADESKHADYILAVYEIAETDYGPARSGIIAAGKRIDRFPVHCNSLQPAERLKFVQVMTADLDDAVTLYISNARFQTSARQECLEAAVHDLAKHQSVSFTLERDATIEKSDRSVNHQQLERDGALGTFEYQHQNAKTEPCLWIPDVVAWHWQRGGRERASVRAFIRDVVHV